MAAGEAAAKPVSHGHMVDGELPKMDRIVNVYGEVMGSFLGNIEGEKSSFGTEWRHHAVKGKQDINIEVADVPDSGLKVFRAVSVLPHHPDLVVQRGVEVTDRLIWEKSLETIGRLHRFDADEVRAALPEDHAAAHLEIQEAYAFYVKVKGILLISARDYADLAFLARCKESGAYFSATRTLEDHETPVKPLDGTVRGRNLPGGGMHLAPAPQPDGQVHTRFTFVILTDIKGSIPTWVVNSAISGHFEAYFTDLRQRMETVTAAAEEAG